MLSARQRDAAKRHHIHLFYDVADNNEGVLSNLPIGGNVVRADIVKVIDFRFWNKFIYLNYLHAFERNRFKLLVSNFYVVALGNFIAFDDVRRFHLLARLPVHLAIADAVARFFIYLVEPDFFAFPRRWEILDGAGHEGQTQKALPICAQGHAELLQDASPLQFTTSV